MREAAERLYPELDRWLKAFGASDAATAINKLATEYLDVRRQRDEAQAAGAAMWQQFDSWKRTAFDDQEGVFLQDVAAEMSALANSPNPGQPLLDRLAKAEGIVGKLPQVQLADGTMVPVFSTVWMWANRGDPYESNEWLRPDGIWAVNFKGYPPKDWVRPCLCHPTREAAEQKGRSA